MDDARPAIGARKGDRVRARRRGRWSRIGTAAAVALALLAPVPARALRLLDEELSLDGRAVPDLRVASAAAPASPSSAAAASTTEARDPSLDFDLLGTPPPVVASPYDAVLKRRRSMLNVHQGLGLALVGLQLSTTVMGQLNYSDLYGPNPTARFRTTHQVLAYTTLGVFAANGLIALLAPRDPLKRSDGFDRTTLHKIGMAVAAAGMVAQGVLGAVTHARDGYLDQPAYARAHLILGYATFAAVSVAVGSIVF